MAKTSMNGATQENVLISATYRFHARRNRVLNSIERF